MTSALSPVSDNLEVQMPVSKSRGKCKCQPSTAEAREFRKRWMLLTEKERLCALQATCNQFENTALDLLPCSGCRNSTETLMRKVKDGNHSKAFLEGSGLHLSPEGTLSLTKEYSHNPDMALALFCHHEQWGSKAIAKLGRGGKANARSRCFLHSQRTRSSPRPAAFESLWNKVTESDRQELAQVDADQFLTDLECYLRRHRFCCRCKEKVFEAYDMLIGTSCSEDDCEECAGLDYMDKFGEFGEELHYSSYLFDELSFCRSSGQIVIPCHMDFMSQLMSRADQEVFGDWADRHARTIAEAQDEVLTCLGMVIWEKMQTLWTNSRCEKRAEELFVFLGTTCIRTSFNIAVESLHGEEMMEQLLAEEAEEEAQKKKKKKKRKKSKRLKGTSVENSIEVEDNNCCNDGSAENVPSIDENEDDIMKNESSNLCDMNHVLDEDAEMQLLSSMGWCDLNREDTPEHDSLLEIPEDDLIYWQENQSQLVSRRMEQRQKLQDRFNDFVLRRNV